jgi:anhydro-N-acetylmuramic acid kinase
MSQSRLVIGLMSGTSLDGIDAVLLRVQGSGLRTNFRQLMYVELPFPEGVRALVLRNSVPETSRVDEITRLNVLFGQLYADAAIVLAKKARVALSEVSLIGSHGQTLHHLPHPVRMFGKTVRATFQIGDPSVIATLTGIPTVGNFRNADMAVGGQGAPLVPYFDWLVFRSKSKGRLLLNIGGIGNITLLPRGCASAEVVFDTGPEICWWMRSPQRLYRRNMTPIGVARQAGHSQALPPPSQHRLAPPPKSAGRENSEKKWSAGSFRLRRKKHADIIRTVSALAFGFMMHTTSSLHAQVDELIVSGGGRATSFSSMTATPVCRRRGEAGGRYAVGDAKEAICFAILARNRSWKCSNYHE